jgi:hypothetical protein
MANLPKRDAKVVNSFIMLWLEQNARVFNSMRSNAASRILEEWSLCTSVRGGIPGDVG